MKCLVIKNDSGTSLVELLVSMGVFLIFMAIAIPTFVFVNRMFGDMQVKQDLNKKGQRVLDYMTEEIRLAGLFVGANPNVSFCGEPCGTNGLEHNFSHSTCLVIAEGPYDQLALLTSEPVVTTANVGSPFLRLTAISPSDDTSLDVNAASGQISGIELGGNANENARAYITFDTVQPTIGLRVYRVASYPGLIINIAPGIDPNQGQITENSNVYSVVKKQFSVNTTGGRRDLQIVRWNKDCTLNAQDLLSSHDRSGTNLWGGVDAVQFEYVFVDGTPRGTITAGDIVNVRAINIWLLIRSDFEERDYTNTTVYTVGTAGLANVYTFTPPANDHFRRMLLSKRVEVKNLEK